VVGDEGHVSLAAVFVAVEHVEIGGIDLRGLRDGGGLTVARREDRSRGCGGDKADRGHRFQAARKSWLHTGSLLPGHFACGVYVDMEGYDRDPASGLRHRLSCVASRPERGPA